MPATHPPEGARTLFEHLCALPQERPLLQDEAGLLAAGELVALLRARSAGEGANLPSLVTLHALAPRELILRLAAADGRAARILLVPAGIDADQAGRLAAAAAVLPATAGATQWLLATSGTTGDAKLVAHTLQSLSAALRTDLASGAAYRWGLLYDPCRFAGLQVLLQALLGGSVLVCSAGEDFAARVGAFVAARVNALSATPTLWRKLLIDGRILACPLHRITLGGEIADQRLLDALSHAFPHAKLRHIYASTEAGVGFSVGDGRAGFPRAYLERGVGAVRLRVDEAGHLWIRPAVAPVVTTASVDDGGYLDTQDLVRIEGERVFFLGRAGGAINVGGNKVHPETVEAVLRAFEGVTEARVGGRQNPFTGQVVVAEVAIGGCGRKDSREDGRDDALLRALYDHCRAHLPPWQVPARIELVAAIEPAAGGKLRRLEDRT
jgi:acyl-CoA synthetase (AMP-forming)/AMP-acid ligase II